MSGIFIILWFSLFVLATLALLFKVLVDSLKKDIDEALKLKDGDSR